MNRKAVLVFVSILVAMVSIHMLLDYQGWPGKTVLPFLFLGFISVYHFASAGRKLFKRHMHDALLSFFVSCLCFCTILKFQYYHYNSLVIFVLVLSIYLITRRIRGERLPYLIGLTKLLAIVNLILVFFPDTIILKFFNEDRLSWGRNLDWEDFKGQAQAESTFDAGIRTSYIWKVNKAYNYPPAVIVTLMSPERSWKKEPPGGMLSSRLLQHEQLHFDISELYRRNALDSISNLWGADPDSIESVIWYFNRKKNRVQVEYDSMTDHGLDSANQALWIEMINEKLNLQ